MNKITKCLSVVALIIVLSVLLGSSTNVLASLGSLYETEPNNTILTANTTYNDYDNYGKISSLEDVDYWKVSFSSNGFANFWLGNIPIGCDYNMRIYKETSGGLSYVGCSTNSSNTPEICKIHVKNGETYYAKIVSESGSSTSYYTFRVKRYDLQDARIFTTTIDINTRDCGYIFTDEISMFGYTGMEYLNNSASNFYNSLPVADLIIEVNNGIAGGARFLNSTLYGNSFTGMTLENKAVSSLPSNALSATKLVIYLSGYSGLTGPTTGNLVDKTLNKGAFCCIGLNRVLFENLASGWLWSFLEKTRLGCNVGVCVAYANNMLQINHPDDYENMTDQYYGTSRLTALNMG